MFWSRWFSYNTDKYVDLLAFSGMGGELRMQPHMHKKQALVALDPNISYF